jgi:hypothetical protein
MDGTSGCTSEPSRASWYRTAKRAGVRGDFLARGYATSAKQAGVSEIDSFRKGFNTTADARGESDSAIAAHCRYESVLSLGRYIMRGHVPHRRNIAEGML